jgi:peptidoglycan/LPS O-acetylase OafA/YrhL
MRDETADTPAPSKLLGLELVRLTCAIAVLLFHYRHFAMLGDAHLMTGPTAPLSSLLSPFYDYGSWGVQIFWGISGFIFYWKYAALISQRALAPKRFFWLRLSRLYPLHFITLLIVGAVQPLYMALAGHPFVFVNNGFGQFVLQLFMADQWFGSYAPGFNGPIWSVSSEVLVYFAFFFLLRIFGRSSLVIVAAIAAGMWSLWSGVTWPALICGAYFFAGGAAAEWRAGRHATIRPRETQLVSVMLVAIVSLVMVTRDELSAHAIGTWLLVATPPLLLIAASDWSIPGRWHRPIQAAGNLTYSTYLIHFPLQLALVTVFLAVGFEPPVYSPWFLLAYLCGTIALGRFVFVRFESPLQHRIRNATVNCRPGLVVA